MQMTITETPNLELEVLEALEKVGDKGLCLREIRQYEHRPSLGGAGSSLFCSIQEYEEAENLAAKGYVRSAMFSITAPDATVDQQKFFLTDEGALRLRVLRGA